MLCLWFNKPICKRVTFITNESNLVYLWLFLEVNSNYSEFTDKKCECANIIFGIATLCKIKISGLKMITKFQNIFN